MDLIKQITDNWWHIPILMALVLVYGFLLNLVLFRPVSRIISKRREAVKEADNLAMRSKDELQQRFAKYEETLLDARRKGSQVKEAARREAYGYRAAVLEEVRAEASAKAHALEAELSADVARARRELAEGTRALALEMAAKVLGRQVQA
ncbi:MAG: ATP synthase F0 subunit B [Acidobacteria bacterium]|nr:ATP synthase F0 subunit B [Acidobacteriota bacterium]